MLVREWAREYVEGIIRATHPYTPLDTENILESFERIHPDHSLDEPISNITEERLNEIGHLLGALTEGKLHLLHHERTGRMHPGIKSISA